MNIHSSPVIVCGTAPPPANVRNERVTDNCGGSKSLVDGSTAGPTDRQASRAWRRLGDGHFLAGFIAAAPQVVCCML